MSYVTSNHMTGVKDCQRHVCGFVQPLSPYQVSHLEFPGVMPVQLVIELLPHFLDIWQFTPIGIFDPLR